MSVFPKVWKLIDDFKLKCLSKGWKTSESYDWILAEDKKYHTFIWAKLIHPSTFERIALSRKCIVKEGLYYQVVNSSYFAWIFDSPPPRSLLERILITEHFSRNNAIYDLSGLYKGNKTCLKINKTESMVFKEFEAFLKELGVKVIPFMSTQFLSKRKRKIAVSGKM